jgi:acetylornithine deacetylase
MKVEEILERLVGFPSVVGRPNADIVGFVGDRILAHGGRLTTVTGPEGDRADLFASFGPIEAPGLVLSGHMDVVPAEEPTWTSDPFRLTADGDRLVGRGTSDMKGFLACMLASLPTIAAARLARPLHLAFSYDEEAGCLGIPHLLARLPDLCERPAGAIVGEPSGLRAIRSHKGKAAARLEIHGRACHSSRPDLGRNAVHAMAGVLAAAVDAAEALKAGPLDDAFEPPWSSLQIGVIHGGSALNIVPDLCTIDVEARAVTGVDPVGLLEPIRRAGEAAAVDGLGVDWIPLGDYPALSLPADAPLARLLAEVTGLEPQAAVSYGTEAGLYQAAGVPAIVCGPGDIARAHRADEWIGRDELARCMATIEALVAHLAA